MNSLLPLQLAYTYLFISLVLVGFVPLQANIRAIILLLGFASVVIAHIIGVRDLKEESFKRWFLTLTLLWGIKLVVFIVNEAFAAFSRKVPLSLELFDLFLLLILTLLVAISFLFRAPFWYFEVKHSKGHMIIGILVLALSGWIANTFIIAITDYIRLIHAISQGCPPNC